MPQEELASERTLPERTDASRVQPVPERVGPGSLRPTARPQPAATRPVTRPSEPPPPEPVAEPAEEAPQTAPAPATPAAETEEDGEVVLIPSQGRPEIRVAGADDAEFVFVIRLRKDLGSSVRVWLVHSLVPERRFPLERRDDVPMARVQKRYGQTILRIPQDVPPGLYDLEVRGSEGVVYYGRHSIRIVERWPERFRFVHLSNMNIDDPASPQFDQMLIDEINVLAPAFVVCTGDFTHWGRMLDRPGDWKRVLAFLRQINAPTFVVCGDRDHEESFDRYIANNPLGVIEFGGYRGILMRDHSAHPLDDGQLKWLMDELSRGRDVSGFQFVVMHNEKLDVLDKLRQEVRDLPGFVKQHQLRMVITGGHADWDLREYARRLKGLDGPDGLVYIRTHQASTSMLDGATGVSHYRVIEVDGRNIDYVYPDDHAAVVAQHSVPAGQLRVFYAQPNDGSQDRVMATVSNALNRGFDDCRVWLRVAKDGDARPHVAGGELVRAIDGETYWMCEIRVDLPDKGGARVAAANADLPEAVPVDVSLSPVKTSTTRQGGQGEPLTLLFQERHGQLGVRFWHCDQKLSFVLKSRSEQPQRVWPVVRLDGNELQVNASPVSGEPMPLSIAPGQTITVPVKLILGRVNPGSHQLQVFFRSDPLKRVTTFPVFLKRAAPPRL